ncbi:S8 family serine peptidase [Brevundimonas sp.]|uniref:S8 family serine peptidase n=1 Tax=Brevundimonas sp. TaxID=1871086 RepID=UPI002FCC13F4
MKYKTVLLSAVAGSIFAFGSAAYAEAVTPAATQPFYMADGSRTADYEAALVSWRNDSQFKIDYSKGYLGLEHAYARGLSGRGLTIGVNDAGIHLDHPIFAAEGKIIGYDSGVPDYYGNNGAVNPRRPWESHGTHVAGTIAADRQDGFRMFGNAYNANIMSATANFTAGDFRWYADFLADNNPNTGFENIIGMAQTGQVRIINNSWGSANAVPYNAPRETVLAQLTEDWGDFWDPIKEHDVLVVWSAGNSSTAHAGYTTTVPMTDPSLRGNWLSVVNYQANNAAVASSSLCGQTATWCVAGPGSIIVSGINHVTFNASKVSELYRSNPALSAMWAAGTANALQAAAQNAFIGKLNAYLNARAAGGASFNEDAWVADLANHVAAIATVYGYRLANPDGYIATMSSLVAGNYDLLGTSFSDKLFIAADLRIQEIYAQVLNFNGPALGGMTGTSMAAPNITGFAGLLMEYFPEYNTSLISDILVSSSLDLDTPGVDLRSGWGVPQMGTALEGPTALRDVREVNVGAGTRDVWTNSISDARDRYSAAVLAHNANDIGGLTKIGGGELVLTNVSNYTGATTVLGGLLTVNGALTHSNISVADVGIIGGIGTLNNLTARAGGVVAPGDTANPFGVLKVTNDALFEKGSFLWIRSGVNGSPSSRLDVGGKTTLQGGNVILKANQGNWNLRSRLTILNSADGIEGKFDGASSDLAFLTPVLTYQGNSVLMTVKRNDVSIAAAGVTANQRAVGAALDVMVLNNTGGGDIGTRAVAINPALENAILDGSLSAVREAIPYLTGEVHAGLAGVAGADSRFIRDAMLDRGRGSAAGSIVQPMNNRGVHAWASGTFGQGKADGSTENPSFRTETSGYAVGVDKAVERGHFGVAFAENSTELSRHALASDADVRSRHIGLYGGATAGQFNLRAGASWMQSDIGSSRSVSLNAFRDSLRGDYEGDGWQAYGEVSWRGQVRTTQVEPYANYARISYDADVVELGGDAALSGTASFEADLVSAGIRTRTAIASDAGRPALTIVGHLAWTENLSDDAPEFRASFADGPEFVVTSQGISGEGLQTGLSINIQANERAAIDFGYAGTHGDYSDNRLFGRLTVSF